MTISKKYLWRDKRGGKTTEIEVYIEIPVTKDGRSSCMVRVGKLLETGTNIVGIDPLQAVLLSVRFVDQLLSSERGNFEVLELDGGKYVTHG
jgi:hypothetical protein